MTKRSIIAALIGALFALAPTAQGQQPDTAEVPEPAREFEVEIIVFEYVSGAVGAREDWQYIDRGRDRVQSQLKTERASVFDSMSDLAPNADQEPANEDPNAEPKPLVWTPIALEDRTLSETFARMRNSRDYRPLVHAAWTQTVYGQTDMTTLALDRVAGLPNGLSASASLYVERFLHLTLDLELSKPMGAEGGSDNGVRNVRYRISEKRKMRSGETHFFDHPRFGAVALISKPAIGSPEETG